MTFGVVSERPLLCIVPTELAATDGKRIDDSFTIEFRIWLVSQNNSLAPTINLAPEWPPVNPKIAFGVVGEHCLLCISPSELTTTERKGLDDSLPMELVIRWVSEKAYATISTQPST